MGSLSTTAIFVQSDIKIRIGDDLRMDYTAVGDTTNLASRVEGMAEPGRIFLSKDTHKLARDFFEFNFLGHVEVKGKIESREIF